ncbi:Helix-turn-helix domain-containing protein [Paenibacillus sp. UNCCL117]|uniref:helix-turn-helix transcriptional regulator n=1 Tax=unclassified Paenibacillus TaxID=185978 RepID=UPI0008902FD7|nr:MULTISPECIES: AraC family transcriptional regulator [unclassified Paenibacillus]SDE27000.1 Helix-turn-helix domain-containing protein [Paenibacillus sp. cl123]SFW62743.1 Helix-turn-helix domain-containing protein [Paenibacillus sp. UNCCL117]
MSSPRFLRYYYTSPILKFSKPEDRYEGWVIIAAQSGRFAFTLEGENSVSGEAGFGDLVICPPGTLFKRHMLEPVSFHFIEFLAEDAISGKVTLTDLQRLSSTFRYMILYERDSSEEAHAYVNHLLGDLLFLVTSEARRAARGQSLQDDALMHQAAAYLEEHACESELSLKLLAARLKLHPSQLSRRFQAAYASSPIEYATEVRLQKARKLLIETELSIDEIAEQCGYRNGFYFSRVFTWKMKLRPSQYRKQYRI